jgi:hypothetical protein
MNDVLADLLSIQKDFTVSKDTYINAQLAKRFPVVDAVPAFRSAGSVPVSGMAAVISDPQADQQKKEQALLQKQRDDEYALENSQCLAELQKNQKDLEFQQQNILRAREDKKKQEEEEARKEEVLRIVQEEEKRNQERKLLNEQRLALEDKAHEDAALKIAQEQERLYIQTTADRLERERVRLLQEQNARDLQVQQNLDQETTERSTRFSVSRVSCRALLPWRRRARAVCFQHLLDGG